MRKVGIIGGAGRIGLALATALAENVAVTIHDTDAGRLNSLVTHRKAPFYEPQLDKLLHEYIGRSLFFSYFLSDLIISNNIIFITIGTGVDRFLNPDFRPIYSLFSNIKEILDSRKIARTFVICSTIYPGTTKKLEAFLNNGKRYKKSEVVFCPERVQTSNMVNEIKKIPQIVCHERAEVREKIANLFTINSISTIQLQNTTEGELAKLFTNAYRYITFAVPNYFYMLADTLGCNYENIERAIKFDYPRMRDFSHPLWTGGSCLIKDTLQLASVNNSFELGYSAFRVHEHLPLHIFRKVRDHCGGDLSEKVIGILGMSFKNDTDDYRESLSFRLKNLFSNEAKRVLCHDQYIKQEWVELKYILDNSDVIIIGAYHKQYLNINFSDYDVDIVDLKGFFKTTRRI